MKQTYKGHKYEVIFCDPAQDWGDKKGMFHIDIAMGSTEYYLTYQQADTDAKKIIDDFLNKIPQTKRQWIDALEDCLVWTGYEDCHINEDMAWHVLNKASLYLKIR